MKSVSTLLVMAATAVFCTMPTAFGADGEVPTAGHGGTLLQFDFNGANAWQTTSSNAGGATSQWATENLGTIDSYNGQPSGALTLTVDFAQAAQNASAGLSSGPLLLKNTESNLAKLTLGFDLWLSDVRPVRVVVQSLDAAGTVTGARFATVLPPVQGAFYRFGVDLDKTQPLSGRFDPLARKIQFVFEFNDEDGKVSPVAPQILRVDNVNFSAPAFYVSAQGSDAADGRTEKTAFATVQKAVNAAGPGDVICVMDGTYTAPSAVSITKSGTPSGYIILCAHPGSKPTLRTTGWDVIKFEKDASYWEIRGLTIRGNRPAIKLEDATADGLLKEKDGKPYYGNPLYNSNGISIHDRSNPQNARPHHIRIIGNTVVDNAGGGISAINCDYVTIEGNQVVDNCHFMRYGGSGISIFRSWNFDDFKGTKMFVVGNVTHGNRTFVPWSAIGKISDGNGIIIDDNINSQSGASKIPYEGRTLVQNNLSFGNGGSGIHAYASNHVDIVNNTAYHNAQSPELMWRQIFAGGKCDDVRIFNNVMVAPKGKPLDLSTDKSSRHIVYAHNLLFGEGDNQVKSGGGLGAGGGGNTGDLATNVQADPKFVKPSLDAAIADFRLAPDSPGIDSGSLEHPGVPRNDLLGQKRPQGRAPDVGAYELPVQD
ncbi:MAG: right-handed parallel beta-helix repeat-containing protein [Armatimonadota bacterium]|nr:right-handed parallel beta-helix repeat-containing protein [Armatimonadota bacterium]